MKVMGRWTTVGFALLAVILGAVVGSVAVRFMIPATQNLDLYGRVSNGTRLAIQAFYDGMRRRPETTFGTVNADVLADKDPSFQPENFCRVIRASAWSG
jgi:hypothetical protein